MVVQVPCSTFARAFYFSYDACLCTGDKDMPTPAWDMAPEWQCRPPKTNRSAGYCGPYKTLPHSGQRPGVARRS